MPEYLLGLDVGTTGCKAVLIDENGDVAARCTSDYPLRTPQPLWSEQAPEDWWTGAINSIRSVLRESGVTPDKVVCVGLSGQMHGLVLLDAQGKVLRPAILWNDQRTATQCADITATVGRERVIQLTGNPVLTGFTAPKIIWVRDHEPDVYQAIRHVLLPKDYVRYRLTGGLFSEVSDASGTSLFDVQRRQWSDEMLDALEIPKDWMPQVTESATVSANIHQQAASATGLTEGTPVVGGGGDQAAQAVGSGILNEGTVSVTLGTSGVVFAPSDVYQPEPQGRLHAFCHSAEEKWHWMGVMLSAAGSFRWYRDVLGRAEVEQASAQGKDPYDLLTQAAQKAEAGCEGLLFLPYLSGERTPHPDPNARGVFFGLSLRHDHTHLTRAVLEGVTFGLRDSLELMRGLGLNIQQVRATGGGAKSPFWRQLLADIFNAEIVTLNATEGAAYGAALLAGVGASVFRDVQHACESTICVTDEIAPTENVEIYERYYARYRALYPTLAPEFEAMAQVVSEQA